MCCSTTLGRQTDAHAIREHDVINAIAGGVRNDQWSSCEDVQKASLRYLSDTWCRRPAASADTGHSVVPMVGGSRRLFEYVQEPTQVAESFVGCE